MSKINLSFAPTFIGWGSGGNRHGTEPFVGLLERHGEVQTAVITNTKKRSLHPEVRKHVEEGANVYSDALRSYRGLDAEYIHKVINHAERYVDGIVHTNGIETSGVY